jgi:hypothetical protein
MDQTSEFAPQFFGVPVKTGTRFQDVLVSLFNQANNPVREFIFNEGTAHEAHVFSPDPGRALITGVVDGVTTFEHTNAFKNLAAAWNPQHGPLLPRQLREDARGRGRALHEILQLRDGRIHRLVPAGRGGHGGLHETARLTHARTGDWLLWGGSVPFL